MNICIVLDQGVINISWHCCYAWPCPTKTTKTTKIRASRLWVYARKTWSRSWAVPWVHSKALSIARMMRIGCSFSTTPPMWGNSQHSSTWCQAMPNNCCMPDSITTHSLSLQLPSSTGKFSIIQPHVPKPMRLGPLRRLTTCYLPNIVLLSTQIQRVRLSAWPPQFYKEPWPCHFLSGRVIHSPRPNRWLTQPILRANQQVPAEDTKHC